MEELFLTNPSAPFHLLDVVVYNGTAFNPFLNEEDFLKQYKVNSPLNLSEFISKSVGVLHSGGRRASAFVVSTPNNLMTTDGNRVKALLLTAAHIYTNPLLDDQKPIEWFFSLAPNYTEEMKNPKYTSFKIHRMFAYTPFESSKAQIDPITGNPYMLPDDVDIVMILEDDSKTVLRSEGNDLEALKYSKPIQEEQKQEHLPHQTSNCFIIGYPANIMESNKDLWAPILSKRRDLEPGTKDFYDLPNERSFAPGHLRALNDTCAAVTCSTWTGMSGAPLCQLSEDKTSLTFFGVYNGSAALPFAELMGRMMFAFKGYPIAFDKDIPVVRDPSKKEEVALFVQSLAKTLNVVLSNMNFKDLSTSLNIAIRQLLGAAEKCGIDVEHNLATTGGCRFDEIIKGLVQLEEEETQTFELKDLFKSFKQYAEVKVDIQSSDEVIERLYYDMFDQTSNLSRKTAAIQRDVKSSSATKLEKDYESLKNLIDPYFRLLQKRFNKIKSDIQRL